MLNKELLQVTDRAKRLEEELIESQASARGLVNEKLGLEGK